MRWEDQAIILSASEFGESSVILEVFTKNRGFHKGLVKGGASKNKKALIQPGNLVNLTWFARLDEQLGRFDLEVYKYYAINLINNSLMLCGFELMRFYIKLLAEREINVRLYDLLSSFVAYLGDNYLSLAEIFIKFEFAYIRAMGVGPDLTCCAATGTTENLCYISPRSLQAVCYEIGKDWHHKLLPLPKFLLKDSELSDKADILSSYKLLTYFLERYIWQGKYDNIIFTRKNFFERICK